MSDTGLSLDALKQLLDEIRRKEAIEAAERGARLHNEKNAPWVNGMYSHLKFPPYQYHEYPRMLYGPGYKEATQTLERIQREFVGPNDQALHQAKLEHAQRLQQSCTKIVRDIAEHQTAAAQFYVDNPGDVKTAEERLQDAVALAGAESNWDDRRLSESAKAEREAFEDQSPDFVTEMPAANPRTGKRQQDKTATQKVAAGAGA